MKQGHSAVKIVGQVNPREKNLFSITDTNLLKIAVHTINFSTNLNDAHSPIR